jgi:phosphoglycolate phosphatase-like HAD superfamily hydrolase
MESRGGVPEGGGRGSGPSPLPMALPQAAPSSSLPRPPSVARPEPRTAERGVVLFDLDGTLLDDLRLISDVAADVLREAFGTPAEEARVHYLATTGMPFEAQLAQLYPDAPASERAKAAVTFHHRKITEAYARAKPFPDVPKLLKRLAGARWTLAVTTGAETEMAELILEREGLRYWFEGVLGSLDGTKREHLVEYQRRYPGARFFLVGDSRFDMEVAKEVPGVVALGRACSLPGWALTPRDLMGWGAAWADYKLGDLPETLERIAAGGGATRRGPRRAGPRRRG